MIASTKTNNKKFLDACSKGDISKINHFLFKVDNPANLHCQQDQAIFNSSVCLNTLRHILALGENRKNFVFSKNMYQAISCAAYNNDKPVFRELLNYYQKNNCLNSSIYFKDLSKIVDQACVQDDIDIIVYTLESLKCKNELANHVFHIACNSDCKDFFFYLENNFKIKQSTYHMGLSEACKYGFIDIAQLIVPRIRTLTQNTFEKCVLNACRNEEFESILFLKDYGDYGFLDEKVVHKIIDEDSHFGVFLVSQITKPLDANYFSDMPLIAKAIKLRELKDKLENSLSLKTTSHKSKI